MIDRKKYLQEKYRGFNYNDRKTQFADWDNLRPDQQALLAESETFCMYPWMHLYADQDGATALCCNVPRAHRSGNTHTHSIEEIFNNDAMKTARKNMIAGIKCKECVRCYEQEDSGFVSMRNSANKHYGHHIDVVDATHEDGSLNDIKFRYWDIRFSNLCNMRCRSCGPGASSNWHDDQKIIVREKGYDYNEPRMMYAGGSSERMMSQILEHIPYVQQIYFAGGEPIIMPEHYQVLDALLAENNIHVKIAYNTNFSRLSYKDKNVLDYWEKFPDISIGASLDGMGAVGELVRKGTVWKDIEHNRQMLLERIPDIDFYISPTVSIMNVFQVADFHREWIERGWLQPHDCNVNILQSPEHYRIDILPAHLKERATRKLEEHVSYLKQHDKLGRAVTGFESAIRFMNATDNSHLIPEFNRVSAQMDRIRNESIYDVVPELRDLL